MRNVLGIEREMILSWGEQVMPCQEHGVGLEGSQEERTGDDFVKSESAAEIRERRAFPSEDSELTCVRKLKLNQRMKMEKQGRKGTALPSIWKLNNSGGGRGGGGGGGR